MIVEIYVSLVNSSDLQKDNGDEFINSIVNWVDYFYI